MAIPIAAGTLSSLSHGEVRVVALPRDAQGRPRQALLLRDAAGVVRAFVNRCRHLPIPLDSGGGRFLTPEADALLCATHGARYRLEDGYCFEGPCSGERLEALEVSVDGDLLVVACPAG